ncbi:MAG: VOC family protein [Micrococcaceae bacterium]
MSQFLGEGRQIGYIVDDVEKAMDLWAHKLNVGPWFYKEDIGVSEFTYFGEPVAELPKVSIALANSGSLQVELIQPRNEVPSLWYDSLKTGKTGPQHIAYWVDDFDDKHAELVARGFVEGHAGRAGGRGRFAYFVHEDTPGSILELSESTGGKAEYFRKIREASIGWDGSDPIRRQPTQS